MYYYNVNDAFEVILSNGIDLVQDKFMACIDECDDYFFTSKDYDYPIGIKGDTCYTTFTLYEIVADLRIVGRLGKIIEDDGEDYA